MTKPTDLTVSALTGRQYVPLVRRNLRRAAGLLKAPLQQLSIVLVTDRRMIELHDRFLGLPTTTDVLTFPIDEDDRGRTVSGEVYVCVPEARRQARVRGVPVAHEVLLYSLHGMLHLCGFDDRTELEYRRMHRREDQILTRLGIGRVFAAAAVPAVGQTVLASRASGRRRRTAGSRRKSE
jgi:probable rRNA maturation factor